MPHIHKIGKANVMCWTQWETDRLPNKFLGKHCKIMTNNLLLNDKKLNKYVNESTMGALDNYANHEDLTISITPLENDIFHDLAVKAYKGHDTVAMFPIKINEGKNALHDFLKEVYEKIAPSKTPQKLDKSVKPTRKDDAKLFFGETFDNIKNFRINQIRKFIEKHQKEGDALKDIADVFEDVHYNELYK